MLFPFESVAVPFFSMKEAARSDRAGPWRIFFAIIVPMSKPVFASVAILTFLIQWGSFLWPVLVVFAFFQRWFGPRRRPCRDARPFRRLKPR